MVDKNKEGDRVQNRQTGEMYVFTNGKWEREPPSMGSAFSREFGTTILDNITGLPSSVANQVMQGVDRATNPLQRGVNYLAERGFGVLPSDANPGSPKPFNTQIFPSNGQLNLPNFQSRSADEPAANVPQLPVPRLGDEILGAGAFARDIAMGAESPNLQESIQRQELTRARNLEERPLTTGAANLLGDAASLITLRARGAPARGRQELFDSVTATAIRNQANKGVTDAAEHIQFLKQNRGLASALSDSLKGSRQYLKSRGARAVDAGIDGYLTGIINGQDPIELAAYGAGGQAASSVLLSLASLPFGNNLTKTGLGLATTALGFGALTQVFKDITPGGEDNLIDSIEGGFQKLVLAIAAATGAVLVGGGRLTAPERLVNALPGIADGITRLQRGAMLSAIGEYREDALVRDVMDKFTTDPNYFGEQAARLIKRAVDVENVSLTDTINNLKQTNGQFQRALGNL